MVSLIGRLTRVKFSARDLMINFLCRFVRRRKGSPKMQRLADFKTAQLDVRTLISN